MSEPLLAAQSRYVFFSVCSHVFWQPPALIYARRSLAALPLRQDLTFRHFWCFMQPAHLSACVGVVVFLFHFHPLPLFALLIMNSLEVQLVSLLLVLLPATIVLTTHSTRGKCNPHTLVSLALLNVPVQTNKVISAANYLTRFWQTDPEQSCMYDKAQEQLSIRISYNIIVNHH